MITAKLFIRGIREPLELTEEQGRKADMIKKGEGEFADLDDKDTISIGDLWTGEKGDIRFIKFETFKEQVQEITFTSKEMYDFESELNLYFIKEDDEEFVRYVKRFVDDIINLDSALFWTATTKNMIWNIRSKFDTFPSLETWQEENKIQKEKDETEENFEIRLKNIYKEKGKLSLGSALEKERDGKVKEEAENMTRARLVGILGKAGELRYLKDSGVIKIDEHGKYSILKSPDGTIGYGVIYHKLEKYKEWKSRKEYASGKEMDGYAEMAEEVVNNMTDEEQRIEEQF